VDVRRWLGAVRAESWLLADSASGDLDAAVPTCPGWTVAEAVRHTGSVFHRVARIVADGEIPTDWERAPAPGADLLGWYDDAAVGLEAAFAARTPGTPLRTWYPPWQQTAFWIRRMAHEVTVHRVDVQSAFGAPDPVDDELAVDGLDEALECFLRHRGTERGVRGDGGAVHLPAADPRGGRVRGVRLRAAGVELTPAAPDAVAEVAGPASAVYLWLWGRVPDSGVQVTGDASAVAALRAGFVTAVRFEA
jgi:uncharacterized protein (TIGR03083 family)